MAEDAASPQPQLAKEVEDDESEEESELSEEDGRVLKVGTSVALCVAAKHIPHNNQPNGLVEQIGLANLHGYLLHARSMGRRRLARPTRKRLQLC